VHDQRADEGPLENESRTGGRELGLDLELHV
jgi:hypothetical protein